MKPGGARRFSDEDILRAYYATSNDEEAAKFLGYANRKSFCYRRQRLGLPTLGIRDISRTLVSMREVRRTMHAHKLGRRVTVTLAAESAGLKRQTYLDRIKRWDLPIGHRRRHYWRRP